MKELRLTQKINCYAILAEHFDTLKSNQTGKTSWHDITLFYVLPVLGAILLAYISPISDSLSNVLITSFSVFAALLFNLLLLVLDAIKKEKEAEANQTKRLYLLLKETYNNIAYSILISLIAICILLIPFVFNETLKKDQNYPIAFLVASLIYFFSINFVLTMAMILKRMHVMLTQMIK